MVKNRTVGSGLVAALSAVFLYVASLHSYLLFHSLVEIFSVVIAGGVFMLAWNARGSAENRNLVYLGIGYLFTAVLDLFHTLSYNGMGIFPEGNDLATKLWICARYLQAATLLLFAGSYHLRRRIRFEWVFAAMGGATAIFLLLIFPLDRFPTCFVEGAGVTPFKRASEYAISAVMAASLVLLATDRRVLEARVRNLLILAIGLTIVSELMFTLYVFSYGFFNLLGHYLKLAAYFLTYKALIAIQVQNRLQLIEDLTIARNELMEREASLREANRAKDRLVSIIAHDLRNPIAGVKMFSELLVNRYEELEERERRSYSSRIFQTISRSLELMETLLAWGRSQIENTALSGRWVDLQELIEGNVAQCSIPADTKKISLCSGIRSPIRVWADPDMVSTVLRNLLDNAVKYTSEGGEVHVEAEVEGGFVRLEVSDTGTGLDCESRGKLFRSETRFSKEGTSGEGGHGLGLILCRELVEKIGGKIWAESEPGRGSSFFFTLPLPSCEETRGGVQRSGKSDS
jgi:signal transduction histidine kinase